MQAHLADSVVEILDHHVEEGLYPAAAGAARRVRPVGSCATLVAAEILARAPELMLSQRPLQPVPSPAPASAVPAATPAAASSSAVAAAPSWVLGELPPGGHRAVSPGLARLLLAPVRGGRRGEGRAGEGEREACPSLPMCAGGVDEKGERAGERPFLPPFPPFLPPFPPVREG